MQWSRARGGLRGRGSHRSNRKCRDNIELLADRSTAGLGTAPITSRIGPNPRKPCEGKFIRTIPTRVFAPRLNHTLVIVPVFGEIPTSAPDGSWVYGRVLSPIKKEEALVATMCSITYLIAGKSGAPAAAQGVPGTRRRYR